MRAYRAARRASRRASRCRSAGRGCAVAAVGPARTSRHAPARGSTPSLGDWEAQVDLTWIVGLLLRGWRKGLDAEAGAITRRRASRRATTSRWWCDRAVEAAGRRL